MPDSTVRTTGTARRGTPVVAHGRRRASRVAAFVVGVSTAATAVGLAVAVAGLTLGVARYVVTPPRRRSEKVEILACEGGLVSLASDADTRLPGLYSFWFDEGRGHARLGDVVSDDGRVVVRHVESVDEGDLTTAQRGRITGWYYRDPAEAGFDFDEVEIDTPVGPAPAWLVPASRRSDAGDTAPTEDRWMIGVHGRGVQRAETLRSLAAFHATGYTSLLVSYRNDGEAPPSIDGRYGLGDTEWADVDAAVQYAVDRGATSVVLMGWSMGGATVLQTYLRSELSGVVGGIVLESPVVDWRTTLRHQAAAMHLPEPMQRAAMRILQSPRLSPMTGQAAPIDLDALDLVAGAASLDVPILVMHSDDDVFVPPTASHALAAARPDIVTLEVFAVARHTKLWNVDPARFDRVIAQWLGANGLR